MPMTSDNMTVSTKGGDETIASDWTGGAQHQRIQQVYSTDGTNIANVRRADTSTEGPMPVNAYLATDYMMAAGLGVAPDHVMISVAAATDTPLVAGATGIKIRVLAFVLNQVSGGTGTQTVRFEDGAGGASLSGAIAVNAGQPFVAPFNPAGWFETSSGNTLSLETSGSDQQSGFLVYIKV